MILLFKLFKVKSVSPHGCAELMMLCISFLNSKAIAPPATLADAPYFLSAKSKQKHYRRVRRPAQRAGCPAVLASDGVRRTRSSRIRLTLRHAAPLIRLPLRSSAATRLIHVKVKTGSSDQIQSTVRTIRLCVPAAHEAPHTSHRSQPKAPSPPENLNEGTERIPLRPFRRHSRWRC